MRTERYFRKTFSVDGIQITEDNMVEVAKWCGGVIKQLDEAKGEASGNRYIWVDVTNPINERQNEGWPGHWVLKASQGFKVYTDRAFHNSFETRETKPEVVSNVFNS